MIWPQTLRHKLLSHLRGVQVTALVGRSGTGKSFRAQLITARHNMDLIVDDGLLIHDQKILAGRSAKVATNAMAAVKAAVFHDPLAAQAARRQIAFVRPQRILILGTSEKMVQTIAHRIGLPTPNKYIYIEDISSIDEIRSARIARDSQGKHIIPVPPIEVRRNYAHMAIDTIKILWHRGIRKRKGIVFEKTVVIGEKRGVVSISEAALTQMVAHCLHEQDQRLRLSRVIVSKSTESWSLEIIVEVPRGIQLGSNLHELRDLIMHSLQSYAGLVLRQVDITIGGLSHEEDDGTGN